MYSPVLPEAPRSRIEKLIRTVNLKYLAAPPSPMDTLDKNFVDAVAKHMGASPQSSYSNRSLRFRRAGRRQKGGYLRSKDRIVLEIWQTWVRSKQGEKHSLEHFYYVIGSHLLHFTITDNSE
jgi:hypothetical protein